MNKLKPRFNRNYLINAYNATSTDDGKGEIETYEAWLERQLISRIEKIELLEAHGGRLLNDIFPETEHPEISDYDFKNGYRGGLGIPE